jgi:hypothetical protein
MIGDLSYLAVTETIRNSKNLPKQLLLGVTLLLEAATPYTRLV